MEQRCYLWNIWLTWLGIPLVGLLVWWRFGLLAGVSVLGVAVVSQLLYVISFPRLSRVLGYGPVDDEAAPRVREQAAVGPVMLYTANLCPFCPIIRRRLAALQQTMAFELREVDVTFRPDLIRAKGLRSVPVVEFSGRFLSGNATTRELAAFLTQNIIPT